MLSKGQYAMIHILAKQVFGVDRDLYEDWLFQNFKVTTSTMLSREEFTRAIRDLEKRGAENTARSASAPYPGRTAHGSRRKGTPSFVTAASGFQTRMIWHLMEDMHWTPGRLFGFIKQRISGGLRDKPEELSNSEAVKCIEALKAMQGRAFRVIDGSK
jgi:hypothetical protein